LRTPVCSYPIIVTHLSFNFLCLLLLYSIYLNGRTQPGNEGWQWYGLVGGGGGNTAATGNCLFILITRHTYNVELISGVLLTVINVSVIEFYYKNF
jgi:hypothetical protein